MIENLPIWNCPNLKPAFNDLESATAVEMVYKLYGKNRELIDDYNKFEENIKKEIEIFKTSTNQDLECFKENITKICNDYIATMDMKIDCQDRKIAEIYEYLTENLKSTITTMVTEMKESGELEEVVLDALDNVAAKINSLEEKMNNKIANLHFDLEEKMNNKIANLHFDNVEEMKNATLQAGDIVQTLGYYNVNDGGKSTYLIRERQETDIEDNGVIHIINDTLVAELICDDCVNVKQFGAKGDGQTDDTIAIQNALDKFTDVYIPNGVFKISTLKLNSYNNLYGNSKKSILMTIDDNENEFMITTDSKANRCCVHDLVIDGNKSNSNSICGGIDLIREVGRTEGVSDSHHTLYNLIIQEINGIGIRTNAYAREGHFHDIYIIAPEKQAIYINGSTDNKWYNITIHSSGLQGIYCNGQMNKFNNIKIFYTGYNDSSCYGFEVRQERQQITDVQIQETIGGGLYINTSQNLISGLLIDGVDREYNGKIAEFPALYLTSRENRITYGNMIEGIITNGNVNSYSKVGLKVDSEKAINNYIHLQITNFKNITEMPQWMKKFEQNFDNFTNKIVINNEDYNDLSYDKFTFSETPSHASNPTNGTFTSFNDKRGAKAVFTSFNTSGYLTFYVAKAGWTTSTKKIIARVKAKSTNKAIRNTLKCIVTYGDNKTKEFLFTQDNMNFSNSTEYEELYCLMDTSNLSNITYVQFELISNQSDTNVNVGELTVEYKDFDFKYIN